MQRNMFYILKDLNDIARGVDLDELNIKNKEDLIKFFPVYREGLSDEDIEFLISYIYSEDMRKTEMEYLKKKFSSMQPDEVTKLIFELYEYHILDNFILDSVENPSILLDNINLISDERNKYYFMVNMKYDDIVNYINENGKQKDEVLRVCHEITTEQGAEKFFNSLNSESDRAKAIILSSLGEDSKKAILKKIKDGYYRNQLVKSYVDDEDYRNEELIYNINSYDEIKEKFNTIEKDEDRAKFINTILDYDMRLELLKDIKSRENRKIVIDGFKCQIDPNIAPQVELVQHMIREYFEDTLQDDFDEDKKERMEIIFNKSDVRFKRLEEDLNGRANWMKDNIVICERHRKNISRTLGFLIHEYSHLLSNYNFKTTGINNSFSIEEGSADLLSDMVINHYIEKHGKIEIDGKSVRVDYPYEVFSGYDFENAWPRTILAGLSSSGKDKKAFAEYILGDKYEYLKLVFGEELAEEKWQNGEKETDLEEIYKSKMMNFSNIDFKSIYAKRNYILSAFELQNRLEDIYILDCSSHSATEVGNKYFGERKIYEISRDEYKEFFDLCMGLRNPNDEKDSIVVGYDDFCHEKITELTEDEIQKHSFEILDTECAIIEDYGFDVELEGVMNLAIQREIELIREGQPIEVTLQKYKRIIPDYLERLDKKRTTSNVYIGDYIEDLKFAYIDQIGQTLEGGQQEKVINGLIDTETQEMYLDDDIKKIFSDHNIQIDSNDKIEKAKKLIKLSKEQDEEISELEKQVQKDGVNLDTLE